MNVNRWLYKIGKILRKYTQRVNPGDLSYYRHEMVRSRASMIATNKGLGAALLIAPPVLVLIATGIAAGSIVTSSPPTDHVPANIPTPSTTLPPAKTVLSNIQAQLQSISAIEKTQDHTTTMIAAIVAVGFIWVVMAVRAIKRRGRGGGGRGENATDANQQHPSGKNNMYREVHVQTNTRIHEENSTLNAGSGGDPSQHQ